MCRRTRCGFYIKSMPKQLTYSDDAEAIRQWLTTKRQLDPVTNCWNWTGSLDTRGYGHLKCRGETTRVHRYAYRLWRGDFDRDLCVLHHCDNRKCFNPDHLFTGTYQDNRQDCVAKGRNTNPKGEAHPRAKLKEAQVKMILLSNSTTNQLAAIYNVTAGTIRDIRLRRHWRHITP